MFARKGGKQVHLPSVGKETLETQVYQALRTVILEGRLAGGERLIQDELATKFGTSRIPVRDALKKLEGDGLVTLDGRGSYIVNSFGVEDLKEIYDLRALLEPYATARAVAKLSASDLIELENLVEDMVQAVQIRDIERYMHLNLIFHTRIYEACQERRMFHIIKGLWSGFPIFTPVSVPGQLERSIVEHQAVLTALKERNVDAAKEAMRTHIQNACDLLLTHLPQTKGK
jgi:DNA-binding GntR family transcriptional regulator